MPDLPYRPEVPTSQTIQFRTDVMKAFDGTEHRMALLAKPRQALDYSVLLDDDEVRQLRADLFNDLEATWRVPLWHEPFLITADVAAGAGSITGSFGDNDIASDAYVYLDREDGTDGEFIEITNITSTTITIDGVTTAAFPAGSYVYPVASGFLSEGQGYARQAVELTEFPLKLTVTDIQALGGSGASVTTYEGLPLLDRRPLADSPVGESFRKRIERIDFGAEVAQITGLDYANIGGGRRFIINDRDELQYFKLFLDTVIGMREPFYVPTWRNDLVYQASPSPGGTTILIETAPSYLTEWHPSDSHRDLQFETTEGTFQRRVASVVDNYDGSHTVTLTSAMPSGAWTVDVISFVERSRLGSDTITLSHFGQSSVVDMAIVTIPEPVPQAVVWGTLVNLTAIYNDLEKTSGDTWAYDAYTVSDQQIPTSNCYFEFASDTHAAYQRRGGLSLAGTDISGGAIEFAIQLNGTQIRVYENGVYATTAATTFTAGDVLRVQVTCNGEVTYWHNGVLFHSSLSAPATFPLEAGVAFYTVGGTITDPVIGEL